MNSSFYSQKTNTDGNFWGRWSGEAKEGGKAVQAKAKATKLPKAADLRLEVHPFLRQVAATAGSAASGALQLASPLQVRAKATQAAVAVWSPTFKGSMVLIRFKNPLLDLAPSKSCNVTFVLEGEGLPLPDTPMKRGPLAITVHVQLDGPALVPSINSSCCKDVLLRRHVKKYNHQGTLRVTLSNPLASGLPVRKYMALDARERAGLKVRLPCVAVVWTSPVGTDPVSFNKAAAALGFHAQGDPQAYAWCCHPRLFPQPLPCSSHVSLDDAELHSDDEVIDLPEGKPEPPAASKPVPKALTEEQEFLLRFELGPPGGFDTNAQSDDVRAGEASPHAGPAGQHTAEELTRLIREKQGDLEQVKRHWTERKERLSGERQEEDPVFKPAMVVRTKPTEDGPISRRLVFDEVVKAKSWKVTDDYWIELETGEWALTWHKTHGQLLQRWFNAEQQRFNDLQAKIEERRKVRNETFVAYRRKKLGAKLRSDEGCPTRGFTSGARFLFFHLFFFFGAEECEQLHFLMEPILKELKLHKRRLRELRQKRAEALLERQRKLDGGLSNAPLPVGFEASVEAAEAEAAETAKEVEPPQEVQKKPWEETKQAADKAFKDKDVDGEIRQEWNTALSLYSKALESEGLESLPRATLLSNRALCYTRLFEWEKSYEDAVDATVLEAEWPKGWLRRATAELRLDKIREALGSLKCGYSCAGKTAGQFLALTTECEAALYNDKMDEPDVPDHAAGRIAKFKEEGDNAFKQSNCGAVSPGGWRDNFNDALLKLFFLVAGQQTFRNSPNDVTVRSDGTIWFTDPDYGVVAKMGHGNAIEQPHNNVFCFDPATKHLRSVSKNECRPNGLCFDPSETYLYVADSGAWFQRLWHPENPHEVVRYRVEADGSLSDRQVIIQLSKDAGGIPDGLRCDAEGHIYVATLEGVHIYTPTGTLLAKIRTPETTANLCFGGPNNTTLLLTSTSCVWAVEMQIAGANVSNVKKERGQEEIRNIDRRDP
eukprot:g10742.t1